MCATKTVYIAEKPSVARAFAAALGKNFRNGDGFMESEDTIVTWCVGHLVSMSYPDAYDPALKKWSMATIPFIPSQYRYQVIDGVKKQFGIVKRILTDPEVNTIYICTDSGREGEYIYRLVAAQAGVRGKKELRVWIDSQTEEEILRGIREAKPSTAYDNLGAAAYLRAQEDYLMGINFSRALTLRYSDAMSRALGTKHTTIAVGRVMTCVLGMVVRREREIRAFVKTPFFRIQGRFGQAGAADDQPSFSAQWQVDASSICYSFPRLYRDSGFLERGDADRFLAYLTGQAEADVMKAAPARQAPDRAPLPAGNPGADPASGGPGGKEAADSGRDPNSSRSGQAPVEVPVSTDKVTAVIEKVQRKKEKKNPPLLYNLAELQNDCSRYFKISPDQTLAVAQELYEKKLTTYPRTDARVLTTAVAKEIGKNLRGLSTLPEFRDLLVPILESGSWKKIGKTRYTNDKAVTDHYAIIPTGAGLKALPSLSKRTRAIYDMIVRRFLAVFYPPAVYDRLTAAVRVRGTELFNASLKTCVERGYLDVLYSPARGKGSSSSRAEEAEDPVSSVSGEPAGAGDTATGGNPAAGRNDETEEGAIPDFLAHARRGTKLRPISFSIREGETAPPKRYTSGSMILAMENAGQLIEEEELREQIRGSGIGTSATRAEILKKLVANDYLRLNSRTQVITPSQTGEMIYDTCSCALKPLLDPRLTASWELGLTQVAEGTVTSGEYTEKLNSFIARRTNYIKDTDFHGILVQQYQKDAALYPEKAAPKRKKTSAGAAKKHTAVKKNAKGGGSH